MVGSSKREWDFIPDQVKETRLRENCQGAGPKHPVLNGIEQSQMRFSTVGPRLILNLKPKQVPNSPQP